MRCVGPGDWLSWGVQRRPVRSATGVRLTPSRLRRHLYLLIFYTCVKCSVRAAALRSAFGSHTSHNDQRSTQANEPSSSTRMETDVRVLPTGVANFPAHLRSCTDAETTRQLASCGGASTGTAQFATAPNKTASHGHHRPVHLGRGGERAHSRIQQAVGLQGVLLRWTSARRKTSAEQSNSYDTTTTAISRRYLRQFHRPPPSRIT